MNTQNYYQHGLLNLVHILMHIDGDVDEREKAALQHVLSEENIDEDALRDFESQASTRQVQDIYNDGITLLSHCTEEERLCALVHLYHLAEADNFMHAKELKILIDALNMTSITFDDVMLSANLAKAFKRESPLQE
jgi:uncharacterized tellurite resistance protein B-like protein